MKGQIDVPIITTEPVSGISGGTSDYEKLKNLPKINGIEIKGELKTEDLNIEAPDLTFITAEEVQEIVEEHIHYPIEVKTTGDNSFCSYVETKCEDCDEILIEKTGVPHTFENSEATSGICLVCGKNIRPTPEQRPEPEQRPTS